MLNKNFWKSKKVFLTGHTGFKGAWLALWLKSMGASVSGYALEAESSPNLYELISPLELDYEWLEDICSFDQLSEALAIAKPEIVIHLAAQPLVRYSYEDPLGTFATNVMGTANLLQGIAKVGGVEKVLVITTDKVYKNDESGKQFQEKDELGGDDPYSASKACAELVAHCWQKSFYKDYGCHLATARAGNVIGGGDWGKDRLIPDLIRALSNGETLKIRNPQATRPWQYVLDVLQGYLLYVEKLGEDALVPQSLNFSPKSDQGFSVGELTANFCNYLTDKPKIIFESPDVKKPEKGTLNIDPSLAYKTLGWKTSLDVKQTLEWTAKWYQFWLDKIPMKPFCLEQIRLFEELKP